MQKYAVYFEKFSYFKLLTSYVWRESAYFPEPLTRLR